MAAKTPRFGPVATYLNWYLKLPFTPYTKKNQFHKQPLVVFANCKFMSLTVKNLIIAGLPQLFVSKEWKQTLEASCIISVLP